MAVTDLTGTKWLLNESLDISSIRGLGYSVNFESNSTSYDFFQCHDLRETIYYGSTPVYTVMDGWSNQAYRTIEITGGTDTTNATLISWLQTNATQIQDESNPISFGDLPIANMYFGTQQVKKVYLGNTMLWEKEENLISFTIEGTTYQAEDGMTWGEWVNSAYNTDGFLATSDNYVNATNEISMVVDGDRQLVRLSDTIIANATYTLISSGGAAW